MAIIFGWGGGKATDLGEVAPGICPNCNNNVFFHYVTSKKAFRLYFVPVASYGMHHYLLCPICSQGMELVGIQRAQAKAIQQRTVAWRTGALPAQEYLSSVRFFWEGQMSSRGAVAPSALPGTT